MASWAPSGPYAWASNPAPAAAPSNWWDGVSNGLSRNSGLLLGLGSGLLSGNLSAIPQGVAQGAASDRSRNLQDTALGLQAKQRNATAEWARKNGYGQYADEIESGAISGSDIFNLINKQTVVPFGSTVVNGNGETVAGGGSSQYGGTGMDAQNWNKVIAAQKDPSLWNDPQTQAAWAQITQPTITYQQTPNGLVPVSKEPNIPAGWGPPSASAAPAAPAPQQTIPGMSPGGADIAAPGGVSVGQPLPGTRPAQTEAQQRAGLLSTSLNTAAPAVLAGYDALADPKQQIIGLGGKLTKPWQSEDYQKATLALKSAISDIVPAISGSAFSKAEIQEKIDAFTPQFGDKPGAVALKKQLFLSYVQSIANSSNDPVAKANAQAVLDSVNAAPARPQGKVVYQNGPVTIEELPN